MVGVSPEYIAEKVVKAIEKDKFIVVTPDLGWIWYLKRYIYPLYVFYQRIFCWAWNKQMK